MYIILMGVVHNTSRVEELLYTELLNPSGELEKFCVTCRCNIVCVEWVNSIIGDFT